MTTHYTTHTLTKAALRAGELLGFDRQEIDRVLQTTRPMCPTPDGEPRLLSPGLEEWRRAVLFVRLLRALTALVGHKDQARVWMHSRNAGLGGTPAELVQADAGLAYVVNYLEGHFEH